MPTSHHVTSRAAIASLLLFACSSPSPDDAAEGEIIGGTAANGPDFAAIGKVRIGGVDGCTGTLVAPRIVLTAAHCRAMAAAEGAFASRVDFVLDGFVYPVVAELTTGPNRIGAIGAGRDASFYLLEDAVPASAKIKPMAIRSRPLDASDEGRAFTVVGYGFGSGGKGREQGRSTIDSVGGNPYKRHFKSEQAYVDYVLKETGKAPATKYEEAVLDDTAYEAHGGLGKGDVQTCSGDSGGPLLDRVGDHFEIVAITTGGEVGCFLGTIFSAIGEEVQDAFARAKGATSPWEPFCGSGFVGQPLEEHSHCVGSEVIQCSGASETSPGRPSIGTIHVDDCATYGQAPTCSSVTPTTVGCRTRRAASAPPPFSAQPDAVLDVAFGNYGGCALRRSGRVSCWGASGDKDGNANDMGLTDVIGITGVPFGFYALGKTGTVTYFGESRTGSPMQVSPTALFSVPGAEELSGLCIRKTDGTVLCFSGTKPNAPVSVPGITNAVQVAGGVGFVAKTVEQPFACARLETGDVKCWGDNSSKNLGGGTAYDGIRESATPVQVVDLHDAIDIAASGLTACAVRAAGTIVCWGAVGEGMLTKTGPLASDTTSPVTLAGVDDAVRVTVGGSNDPTEICALRRGGSVTCWGDAPYLRRLPANDQDAAWWHPTSHPKPPVDLRELIGVSAVRSSASGSCVLARGGAEVWCWGDDVFSGHTPGLSRSNWSVPYRAKL